MSSIYKSWNLNKKDLTTMILSSLCRLRGITTISCLIKWDFLFYRHAVIYFSIFYLKIWSIQKIQRFIKRSAKYFRRTFFPFILCTFPDDREEIPVYLNTELGYRAGGNIFIGTIGADMRGFFDFVHAESHHGSCSKILNIFSQKTNSRKIYRKFQSRWY